MNKAAASVLFILGFAGLVCTLVICAVAYRDGDVKDAKELGVFCLGAVSGILAKVGYDATNKPHDDAQKVTVVNPPTNPIPTDPQ